MSQPQTFKLHLVGTSGESKPRTQLDADAAASDAVKLDLRTTVKSPDSNKKVSLTLPCTVRFTLPSDSSLVPSLLSRQQKLQSTTTERPVDVGVVTSDVKQRSKLNQESKLAAGGGGDVRAIPTTTTRQPAPIRQKSPEKLSVRMNNKTPLGSLNKMPDDSSSRLFASSYSRFESPSKSYIHVEQVSSPSRTLPYDTLCIVVQQIKLNTYVPCRIRICTTWGSSYKCSPTFICNNNKVLHVYFCMTIRHIYNTGLCWVMLIVTSTWMYG